MANFCFVSGSDRSCVRRLAIAVAMCGAMAGWGNSGHAVGAEEANAARPRWIAATAASDEAADSKVSDASPAAQTTARPDATPIFRRQFEVPNGIQSAELRLAVDFARASLRVNGRLLARVEPYCPLQTIAVTGALRRGQNDLEVMLEPVAGPAAFALSLAWQPLAGPRTTIISDATWRVFDGDKPTPNQPATRQPTQDQPAPDQLAQGQPAQGQPAVDRGPVADELWGIGRRDIGLAADENYEQWRQTRGEDVAERRPKFWTAPGFEVTLVRAAAADEGSWIAMAFDDEGRLTVSREDRGLLRFTLDSDRASVTSVERFELPLEECRGLIYADGWLYANANNSRTV